MDAIKQDNLAYAFDEVPRAKGEENTSDKLKTVLSISMYLYDHPVLKEPLAYRIKYLAILEYFVNEYAKTDLFSAAALHCYKQTFLGDDFDSYGYVCDDLRSQINWIIRTRFRSFEVISHRFILAMDIIFLCALDDEQKGHTIFCQIKGLYHSRYHAVLDNLYDVLYWNEDASQKLKAVYTQINHWQENAAYLKLPVSTTLFVANMSAGKSTLINALIGKKVNRSLNQACTAKLHYIVSKAYEDGYSAEYDYLLDLNASYDALMRDNPSNTSNEVIVSTAFNLLNPVNKRLCFVDTPGANFSVDTSHRDVSHWAVSNIPYDTLVFIFAAGTTGINDDFEYLHFIKDHHRKGCRLIFVFNKLDEYKDSEDSLDDSIAQINADLQSIGFPDYELCPISAVAGMMAKEVIQGKMPLPNSPEFFHLLSIKARFGPSGFDFSKFYDVPGEYVGYVKNSLSNNPEEFELLLKSGILGFEYILTH